MQHLYSKQLQVGNDLDLRVWRQSQGSTGRLVANSQLGVEPAVIVRPAFEGLARVECLHLASTCAYQLRCVLLLLRSCS